MLLEVETIKIQINKEQSVKIANRNRGHYSLEYRNETANMVWTHEPNGQLLERKKRGRPPKLWKLRIRKPISPTT